MKRPRKTTDTAEKILNIAQRLVQTRGFNGFSYADIAAALGVSKASLYYHFATKSALGVRLITRYEKVFMARLAAIDAERDSAIDKLKDYVAIYNVVLRANRICMCGMLAAEFGILSKPMRQALEHYFAESERWLAAVLDQGRAEGDLKFTGSAEETAQFLVGALEGSMMLARSHGTIARFNSASRRILAGLGI
ncbi:MAG: TetR/AcrR family transcriptional regulator [Rhizobiales bacterium]|nr:TetR/AcrR family transcriptional regulator [Hyphomicrobiales bacterium]MBI3673061.1 TetR/AcrR family transcriptional regulator [Hyphomicrobiales bacterium]